MLVKQAKTILKVITDRDIDYREALKQVFEQGGKLWATNGYIAIKVCDAVDKSLIGKAAGIDALKAYCATHKPGDVVGLEVFTENYHSEPDMCTLCNGSYEDAGSYRINIDLLKLGCDYLGIKSFTLERSVKNPDLYRLKPINEKEMHILTKAEEAEVYIMGLKGGK